MSASVLSGVEREGPIGSIAEVRRMEPDKADRKLAVEIEGTVMYYDKKSGDLFVQDGTACGYINCYQVDQDFSGLRVGRRLRLRGNTIKGSFFPDIWVRSFTLLDDAGLPEPRRVGEAELFAPALDSQWVEVPAVVTGVERGGLAFTLAVEVHGWKLKAELPLDPQSTEKAAALMLRPVRLRGLLGTVFNEQRQMTGRFFYVPSFDQIVPTDTVQETDTPPLRTLDEMLRCQDGPRTRMRVRGTVTQSVTGGFYLRDLRTSALVQTTLRGPFEPGMVVEVEGFAAIAPFRPLLRATRITVAGREKVPDALPFRFVEKLLPGFHAELVSLDAVFVARRKNPADTVLQCRLGDRLFDTILPGGRPLPEGLAEGDILRLTGVCEVTTTHPTPRTEWADGMVLHLGNEGTVRILRHAPWWTLHRLLLMLGTVSAVSLAALVWVWQLRRRVRGQTETIGAQLRREAMLEERQRIARELHDAVEQQLTGLSMQLGNVSEDLANSPSRARQALSLAQGMLRHCREETRESIRDLRQPESHSASLSEGLRETLPGLVAGTGAELRVAVTGEPRRLDIEVEKHLHRIVTEAVANAVRHGRPAAVTVDFEFGPAALIVAVGDDGCGFDPRARLPSGHFGLLGIRERANKIGADVELESSPGRGTRLRLTVPLHP